MQIIRVTMDISHTEKCDWCGKSFLNLQEFILLGYAGHKFHLDCAHYCLERGLEGKVEDESS